MASPRRSPARLPRRCRSWGPSCPVTGVMYRSGQFGLSILLRSLRIDSEDSGKPGGPRVRAQLWEAVRSDPRASQSMLRRMCQQVPARRAPATASKSAVPQSITCLRYSQRAGMCDPLFLPPYPPPSPPARARGRSNECFGAGWPLRLRPPPFRGAVRNAQ